MSVFLLNNMYVYDKWIFFSNSNSEKPLWKNREFPYNCLIEWNKIFNMDSNVSSDNENNYSSLMRAHMQWETCVTMGVFWP